MDNSTAYITSAFRFHLKTPTFCPADNLYAHMLQVTYVLLRFCVYSCYSCYCLCLCAVFISVLDREIVSNLIRMYVHERIIPLFARSTDVWTCSSQSLTNLRWIKFARLPTNSLTCSPNLSMRIIDTILCLWCELAIVSICEMIIRNYADLIRNLIRSKEWIIYTRIMMNYACYSNELFLEQFGKYWRGNI